METVSTRLLLHNWQRKILALLAAVIAWFFVSHSIQETKIVANVPVRIVNLPADKTILGMQPNGVLSKRITLTLTGAKDVIEELESGDVEVVLDASFATSDQWIVQISKKNLVSLNPSIDLVNNISAVDHPDFVIKLSSLVTAKIPVAIEHPTGVAPQGYEFLDVWPSSLMQTISGPEEEIQALKDQGLKVTFDLSDILKGELDALKSTTDEVSYAVPKKWKQVNVPFQHIRSEELNDPESQNLRIDFLRKEFLALNHEIPIRVFYPLEDSVTVNPENSSLALNQEIQKKDGITVLTIPLFSREVSQLFLDVVKDYMEIVIIPPSKKQRESFGWSVEFINPRELEDVYVARSLGSSAQGNSIKREKMLRKRFRDYMQRLALYTGPESILQLKSSIENGEIQVNTY